MNLPSKAEQKSFYESQKDEIVKSNLQNVYTIKRMEKYMETLGEDDFDDLQVCKQTIKECEAQIKRGEVYLEVADECLRELS